MSTSGTTTWALVANQIIRKAYQILGVGSEGETLTARQYSDGMDSLNLLAKTWSARLHIWKQTERTVTLVAGQAAYPLSPKPLRVVEVRRRVTPGNIDTPLIALSRQDYLEQPNKTVQSIPTSFWYDPKATTGTLYVWPTASATTASTTTLHLTQLLPIEDFTASNDDADFPNEWMQALVWNLANELEPEYPLQDTRLAQKIEMKAAMLLNAMNAWDEEPVSVYIQPDFQGH